MTKPNTTKLGRSLAAVCAGALLAAGITDLNAAVRTWDGGGNPDFSWSNPSNWDGDSTAPVAGDYLVFDGTVGLTNNNDLAADTSFSAITFPSTAGAFMLSGNAIKLGANGLGTGTANGTGGVTNDSSNIQTFDMEAKNDRVVYYVTASADIINIKRLWDWRYYKRGPHDLICQQTLSGMNGEILGVNEGRVILNALVAGPIGHGVTIDAGGTVVCVGPADQISSGRDVVMNGGLFQVQNTNELGEAYLEEIAMLRGSALDAIVENGSALGPIYLEVGGSGGNRVGAFDGTLRNGGAGALGLRVKNAGTALMLSGTNTYSGETIVTNSGTGSTRLVVNGMHTGGGAYTIEGSAAGNDAVLCGTGSISPSAVNINANGAISMGGQLTGTLYTKNNNTGSYADTAGTLTVNAPIVLGAGSSLAANLASGGHDQLNAGGSLVNNGANLQLTIDLGFVPSAGDKFTLVQVQGTDVADNTGVFTTLNGVAADLSQGAVNSIGANSFRISYTAEGSTFEGAGNDIMIEFLASSSADLTWKGNVNDDWDIGGTANWINGGAATYADLDKVTFDGTATSFTVELTTAVNPTILNVDATQNYLFYGAGKLTGPVVMNKTNSGTLILVTDNDNAGTTTIEQGTLQVGTNTTYGTLSGSVVVNAAGVLDHKRQDDQALASVSGPGTILHSGDGKLIVTNDLMGFTGALTNSGGLLQIGNGTTAGNGGKIGARVFLPSGKSLLHTYFGNGNITPVNSLSGSGSATYEFFDGDPRTITLGSAVTNTAFTGTTTVKTFTRLEVNAASAVPAGPIVVEGTAAPAFGAYYSHPGSSVTNLNSITISGEGPASPVDTPRGKGALRLGNVWAGSVTLSGNATIGGDGTGTIIGNIGDGGNNYTLEYLGGTLQVGPTSGVNTYGTTRINEDYFGSFTQPTLTTLRALNGSLFGTGPVEMKGRARFDLNGNDVAIGSLVDVTLTTVNGTTYAPTVANGSGSAPATVSIGSDGGSTFIGTFINGSSQPLNVAKTGAGTFTVSGDSTCTGTVSVEAGTLALVAASGVYPDGITAVTGSGSFSNAMAIAVATGATLDVSGRSSGTLQLTSGQVLKHTGVGTGPITVTGNVNIGNGTLLLALNRSGFAHDSLAASGTFTASGTLEVANIGAALQVGDVFQLFPGAQPGFATFVSQDDVANNVKYTWNNTVAADGKITVASVVPLVNATPGNILASVSGSTLKLEWPEHLGWSLQAQTNALDVGLSNNWVTIPGSESVTNMDITIAPGDPAVFYRLFYTIP